jgi:Ca-activated chloride channel family protein
MGEVSQLPVVAIYPKEGTFWSNHPYIILNAPWVTEEQREAAELFEDYLLAEERQRLAIEYGFRPADPAIALSSPLDTQHGVDPNQPQTVLEVPDAEVVVAIRELWQREAKRPVDLVVLMDISASMEGDKINTARTSLIDFIDLLGDRDRLELILFRDELITMTPLTPLGEKRADIRRRIAGIFEEGETRLYDAVQQAYNDLEAQGDPEHIRAIVVLSDGEDTLSGVPLERLLGQISDLTEGGDATKVFTIAFGEDADREVLRRIADLTGGKAYDSDPQTIHQVYAEIATFF